MIRSAALRSSLVAVLVLGLSQPIEAQSQSDEEAFLQWARDSLYPISDLASIDSIIDGARIVGLSELLHGAAEPLEFRNRLFRHLVLEHGFSAIAIESGVVESKAIYDYVLGNESSLDVVLKDGLGWTSDILPQNAELLSWMREYNSSQPENAKIRFFGLDVPGSPGNDRALHGPEIALQKSLEYLELVDPVAAEEFSRRVDLYLPRLQSEYGELPQRDRDALTIAISDLIGLLEVNEWDYTSATSESEFQWAHRAAIGARQVDAWLRQWPVGWSERDYLELQVRATRVRDRAMADNLDWIVQQLGPEARVLMYAAATHLATAPVTYVEAPINTSLGTHTRNRYGDQLVTITTLIGGGTIGGCGEYPLNPLADAPTSTISGLMLQLGEPLFILDFRSAPPKIESWLSDIRDVWSGFSVRKVRLSEAFDAGFFVDAYSPACN
jgi:erythromycin esterase